jgi:hypothetical protein
VVLATGSTRCGVSELRRVRFGIPSPPVISFWVRQTVNSVGLVPPPDLTRPPGDRGSVALFNEWTLLCR